MKLSFRFFTDRWDWVLCFVVLCMLGMFLLGYDVIGLNGPLAGVLGLVGGLVLPIILLVFAPIILFIGGLVTMLVAFVTALFMMLLAPLLGFLVGAVVLPLITFVTGMVTALMAWLATTWLGVLLAPVINAVTPFLIQYGPWLALGRNVNWFYDKVYKNRHVKKVVDAYWRGRKEGRQLAGEIAEQVEKVVDVTPRKQTTRRRSKAKPPTRPRKKA